MAILRHAAAFQPLWRTIQRTRVIPEVVHANAITRFPEDGPSLDILFFVNKYNSLSQRVARELSVRRHRVEVCEVDAPQEMVSRVAQADPDIIMCPFLKTRIPKELWSNANIPCLIVHPGIEGDRGMSSIDWALRDRVGAWGVTVLQADEEMDAGNVWSTTNFGIDRPSVNNLTKSSLYANEVTQAAVRSGLEAIQNFVDGVESRPLDYSEPHVRGTMRRKMKKADRFIDWAQSDEDVARLVRMSDSSPGAVARLRASRGADWTEEMRVFGAHLERNGCQHLSGVPGELLGQRDNAVLVKCGSGALWLSHIKKNKLKLPSMLWLGQLPLRLLPTPSVELPRGEFPGTFQEIWTSITPEGVCFVNFDFYNGAMSTPQCERLENELARVEEDGRVGVIVLMGGFNYFSNGIHLNVIESAADPAHESWRNINAINNVVRRIFMSNKVTISAVQGNAGAGGAMMALASDLSFSRDGVVLNPHYRTMHLHGSEYHTHFLPARVGERRAQELLQAAAPILAAEAVRDGFLDWASGGTHREFDEFVGDVARHVARPSMLNALQKYKAQNRDGDWIRKLQRHRLEELAVMAKNFGSEGYRRARKEFVLH